MRLIALLLLTIIVLPGTVGRSLAAAPDPAYQKARDAYTALQSAPRKQKFRSEWDKVLHQFVQVYERAPAGPQAGEALFMAGKTLAGLYRVSQVADDAWLAVAMYERVAAEVPASSLGDDALALAAEMLENRLAAPDEAYLRYQRIVEQYPRGDQAALARTRLSGDLSFGSINATRSSTSSPSRASMALA